MTVRPGIDGYLDAPPAREGVGLLTNVASLTADGRTLPRALRQAGVTLAALFGPEHGYYGVYAAGEYVEDEVLRDVPVYSLYQAGKFAPASEVLATLTAMLIDLQDVGARWYTYLATLQRMLRACAAVGLPVYVLDRPNPLGGLKVEGNRPDPAFFTLVAAAEFPVRYGLTIGEAAHWLNRDIHATLTVVPLTGWRREMLFAETGLTWQSPSPGIPHAATALPYTGTCLIEGLNVSEGRGTPLPFEQIGAPFIHAEALADQMNALALPGVSFRPCWFRPLTSKHAGQACQGVRVSVTDAHQYRGFAVGVHLVATLLREYREQIEWVVYEGKLAFDNLCSTDQVRLALEGGRPADEVIAEADAFARQFAVTAREYWLYPGASPTLEVR
jgi:uncharacterized protein YbbC (DUF1343 family)